MAKQNTTPKQSAGGGYQFENEVVSYVLIHLLSRVPLFDPPGGTVERVDTQRPATEWHLDDLLVTARSYGSHHRLAFSVKSNRQITAQAFPSDFIREAWEQLLHETSDAFDEKQDYLGLITAPVDADLRTAVSELLRLARGQDPEDLAVQVGLAHRANATIRSLHDSARCPDDLAAKHGVDVDTSAGRLLRRLLWFPVDFEDEGSLHRARAHTLCQNVLRSGSPDEARSLWTRLKEVADRLRRSAGSMSTEGLVGKLRGQFDLREYPDHADDWERVDEETRSALRRVRSTIGGRVVLPREASHEALAQAFGEGRTVVLVGASGTGKSALAKNQAEATMQEGQALWFDAERLSSRSLAEWRRNLGLTCTFGELMRTTPAREAVLVLDGLDRLYDAGGFATAAELVEEGCLDQSESPWRLLITCTPEEWDRVRGELISHGVVLPKNALVSVDLPGAEELDAVWDAFPRMAVLSTRRHLAPVLFRPKVLDLLASSASDEDDLSQIGESDLAHLFWEREVLRGPNKATRADVARLLGEHLADNLMADASVSALSEVVGADRGPTIDELVQDRVLVVADGRVSFDHDLYGDWVRARQLRDVGENGRLLSFLASRLKSPIWHRALRLHGIMLLEGVDDPSSWRRVFEEVGELPVPVGSLAQDILLEATAFAATRGGGLLHEDLWSLLAGEDGSHLERLLKRLFHTGTFPNTAVVDAVTQEAPDLAVHIAAGVRLPYWPYWHGILALLHARCNEIPSRVRGLAARAAHLWLRSTRPGWPLRKEAAAVAVVLGDELLAEKEEHDHLFFDGDADQHVYRAVLAASHEEPDRVTQIILEAAGRRDKRYAPEPLTDEELSELKEKLREKAPANFPPMLGSRSGPLPAPWPHGPAFRVDGALQKVVLETDALGLLAEALPDIAREALLALLISEPKRRASFRDDLHDWHGLEWPRWHPQFYTRGPFRAFLAISEDAAITTILQLVDHTTERWAEARARRTARDNNVDPKDIAAPTTKVEVEGEVREYVGDARVFGWSQYGPDSGQVVGSALTALEKHLYDRADAGDDLSALIRRLLMKSRSLAIIGLLSVFGRRHPQYLRGILQGLLGSPDLLQWTLLGSVADGWASSLSHGSSLIPEPLQEAYREWHEMPHRKISLRDCATTLFVYDPEMQPFFERVRERLVAGLQPGGEYEGWPLVESFAVQIDSNNYEDVTGDDGKSYVQYTPPEDLRKKYVEDERLRADELLVMSLPLRCRQLLDGETDFEEGVLDEFWEQAQRVETLNPDVGGGVSPPSNALAGVAALLILKAGGHRGQHSDREAWARNIVLDALQEDRSTEYGGVTNWDRLTFATEALPTLWADQPEDARIREAVARLAFHGDSQTVGLLASGAARARKRLHDDHVRLVHAILIRSALTSQLRAAEHGVRFPQDGGADEKAAQWEKEAEAIRTHLESTERALVQGTLDATIPSLDEVAPLRSDTRHGHPARPSRRYVPAQTVDEGLLIAAFRGIPDPTDRDDKTEVEVWERAVQQTFSLLAQPPGEPTADLEGTPGAWDRYLVERVAGIVAGLDDPDAAKRLWQPIIRIGASATDWVSWFLKSWTPYVLYRDAHEHVIDSWVAMIDLALTNPRWAAGSSGMHFGSRTAKLWGDLLGFTGFGHYGGDMWTAELRPRVRRLQPQLATWASSHLANSKNARLFSHFLTLPAAADLVLVGLGWLHTAANTAGVAFWGTPRRGDQVDDAVLSLLVHVWNEYGAALRQNASAFTAFTGLLEVLVSKQHPPALELADRVGALRR